MSKAIILSLHDGVKQYIETPESIVAYLVKFLFINPGNTSSTFSHLLSFRRSEAQHEEEKKVLIHALQSGLQQALDRFEFIDSPIVSMEETAIEGHPELYGIKLDVAGARSGKSFIDPDIFVRTADGIKIMTPQ